MAPVQRTVLGSGAWSRSKRSNWRKPVKALAVAASRWSVASGGQDDDSAAAITGTWTPGEATGPLRPPSVLGLTADVQAGASSGQSRRQGPGPPRRALRASWRSRSRTRRGRSIVIALILQRDQVLRTVVAREREHLQLRLEAGVTLIGRTTRHHRPAEAAASHRQHAPVIRPPAGRSAAHLPASTGAGSTQTRKFRSWW